MVGIDFLTLTFYCLAISVSFMTMVFILSRLINRVDIVDISWGLVFIMIAFIAIIINGGTSWSGWLVATLIFIWGGRLAIHIYQRFRVSTEEDKRYVELRNKWPKNLLALQIYTRIFIVQAIAALIISLPVVAVINSDSNSWLIVAVGFVVWLTGFLVEAIADRQLSVFISSSKNHGKLMNKGIWQYSRHPNYFGEITQWWGIWIISLTTPYWVLALAGPILITLLICFISGIPPTERAMSRKPGWKSYKQKTSILIPWLPKS